MAKRYTTNGFNGGYVGSTQWLQDGIRAEWARKKEEWARERREAAEAAERMRAERDAAIVARGRRSLAKRYHPDRHPAGAAKMVEVNRIADKLEAGVRRFPNPDHTIAREIIAAGLV